MIGVLDRSQFSVKPLNFEDLFTTEIPSGNDPSQDPGYGLGTVDAESINIESISALGILNDDLDVSMPAGISIANI
jgi:hypothetical protein